MAQIICIANQKGGVGKTTTAINIAAAMADAGKETLLVDCDPQANATTGIGVNKADLTYSLYHGLIGEASAQDTVADTYLKKLKIIPSRVELIGFEVEMMSQPNREKILKNLLHTLSDSFDYIIIDCPPSLSLLTLNAMTAADYILIPLQSEFYALEGLGQLLQTVKKIKENLNPGLRISGIVLTMFDKRTNLSLQVAENAEKYFKELVFKTRIPRNVRLGEAPSFGKPIIHYDSASTGSINYLRLAKEIMKAC
jgi:chromosome partitioning protein